MLNLYTKIEGREVQVSAILASPNMIVEKTFVYLSIGTYVKNYTLKKKSSYTITNEKTYFTEFYLFLIRKEIFYVDEVTKDTIVEYQSALSERLKASTVNRQFSTLNHFFNVQVQNRKIVEDPCRFVPALSESKPKIHIFTVDDFIKCYWGVSPRVRDVLFFMWYSGARTCEAINLMRSDIDYDTKTITLRTKKVRGQKRTIVLYDELDRFLHTLPMTGDLVFGRGMPFTNYGLYQSVKRSINRYCKNTKLNVKSIRHTFCTFLFVKGLPAAVIQEMMGHASLKTTEKYKHITKEHVKNSLNSAKINLALSKQLDLDLGQ